VTRIQNPVSKLFGIRARLGLVAIAGAALGLGGCTETDSFLFDPFVLGRWEKTATTVPILNRLGSIEGPSDEQPDVSEPTQADMVPEVIEYRIGPGDVLTVTVFDLPDEGRTIDYQRIVDPRGIIELPQVGQVYLNGMTSAGAETAIKEEMKKLIARPMAAVLVVAKRAERYSVVGAVQNPGQYAIPAPNFRLLEALSASGTFSESADFVYVIRQVPLSETATGRPGPARATPKEGAGNDKPSGEQLIDTINRLSKPETPKPEAPKQDPPKPDAPKPGGLPGMMQPERPAARQPELLDLPGKPGEKPQPTAPAAQPDTGEMAWINIDGKWVKVKKPAGNTLSPPSPIGLPSTGEQMLTQRIIRVPVGRLVSGDASVNIIVRAGDVVRVPPSPPGTIYLAGTVARPGAYGVAEKVTMLRMIASAGGLSSLAAAEKVDLTRMVGPDRQATIRLNLKAIAEGTHPDIFLKGNDLINVGSSFWAYPMAIIRNGFRMTYGFGFLADRNFGNDLFGAPPTNSNGQ